MKKTIVILAMLFLSSVSAQAQTDGGMMGEQKDQVGQGMRMGEGQQMQMMQMCMPMMKQMMGQGMMVQDMMQMMTDMMKMMGSAKRGPLAGLAQAMGMGAGTPRHPHRPAAGLALRVETFRRNVSRMGVNRKRPRPGWQRASTAADAPAERWRRAPCAVGNPEAAGQTMLKFARPLVFSLRAACPGPIGTPAS